MGAATGDGQDSQGPLPVWVGNPRDAGAITTHTKHFTRTKAHRVLWGPEMAPKGSGAAPKYESPRGLMVLGAGSTLSSGFSPGREEPVSGAREPEESWQDRGQSRTEQISPGSQRWSPLLPQVERTEVLRSCSSPVFSRVLALEYFFEEKQPLQFHVFDAEDGSTSPRNDTFLGSTECTLGQVCVPTPTVLPAETKRRQNKLWS